MKKRMLVLVCLALFVCAAFVSAEAKPISAAVWGDFYASYDMATTATITERETYLTFSGSPDEATTGYFRVIDTADTIGYDRLYFVSDIAKYFKLEGVGLTLSAGYLWTGPAYYMCTNNNCWDTAYYGWGFTAPAVEIAASYGSFGGLEFELNAANPAEWAVDLTSSKDWGFGTLSAEVYYDSNTTAMTFKGTIQANATWNKAFGDITPNVGVGFAYDMTAATTLLDIAGGVAYKSLASVYLGYSASTASYFFVQCTVSPIALVDLKAACKYDIAGSALAVLEVEASLNIGAADIILGYDVNGGNNWNDAKTTTGGPYFGVELSY